MELPARLVLVALKALLVQLVHKVFLALLVQLALPVHKVLAVLLAYPVPPGRKVPWGHPVLPELPGQVVPKVFLVFPGQRVQLGHKVLQGLEQLGNRGSRVLKALLALRAPKAFLGLPVISVPPDL